MLDAASVRRLAPLFLVGVVVAAGVAAALIAFFVLPGSVVDDARFKRGATDPVVEEKRLKARHDVRTVGVQLVGALALIVGGALTWRTVWLTREGQITDRLGKAIEQLGETDKQNVRVGAIHALARVARDSRADHAAVLAVLAEHLRAKCPAVNSDGQRMDLGSRRGVDPEVRAVAMMLRARRARWDPKEPPLNLSGIDFRNAPLQGVDLRRAHLQSANFRGAYLSDADLSGARLDGATLHGTNLQRSCLKGAGLTGADLRYLHADKAVLRAAEFDEAKWENTELRGADLRKATGLPTLRTPPRIISDKRTRWPTT